MFQLVRVFFPTGKTNTSFVDCFGIDQRDMPKQSPKLVFVLPVFFPQLSDLALFLFLLPFDLMTFTFVLTLTFSFSRDRWSFIDLLFFFVFVVDVLREPDDVVHQAAEGSGHRVPHGRGPSSSSARPPSASDTLTTCWTMEGTVTSSGSMALWTFSTGARAGFTLSQSLSQHPTPPTPPPPHTTHLDDLLPGRWRAR